MFTGLIEGVGELVDRSSLDGGHRLRIATSLAGELTPGESIAVNGVCLTVTAADDRHILADVGPETSRVTTLGGMAAGQLVNLERPMRADARFGGHFVQGHVDAVGRLEDVRPEADFHWLTVSFPRRLARYIVEKGSIAVDGISLTVARLGQEQLEVMIIPFTMTHTNLVRVRRGTAVNLECDLVGKYVVRAVEIVGSGEKRDSAP
jgi:riboflavin synthase